jgi:DNA (cytosine-5)-methyltransferase 1
MNELSLFSGAGGGLLGTKLLNFKTIGYVENEEYCQQIIAGRIKDGLLENAPIFDNIKTFLSQGAVELYRGITDVITAGFPCQPYSVAGKGRGQEDDRNLFPETLECIVRIRPKFALLENVPGLLIHEYSKRIYGELAKAGYNARWCNLGAADCGGRHKRQRWWLLAYPKSE